MTRRIRNLRRAAVAPQWELDAAITVVLFAGLGGACEGLEDAGCPVHVANNHDDVALAAHAENHPHTRHVRGDIFDVDPARATGGRRVKILWASPDCRDHSVAKGGAPRSARVRSLPWQVCRWIGATRPRIVMMENVREIRGWGPLVAKRDRATGRVVKADGTIAAPGERMPLRDQQLVRDKARAGRSYRRFVAHIRQLGYELEAIDACCADYGIPTSRRRWFAVARCDGAPIAWPVRTHAPADQAARLGLLPWVGAHTIIDWSVPMPSIFDRKKPLAAATERRIAVGLQRYVLDNPRPFIVPITHSGTPRVHDLDEPLRTLTTAHRGELAVVAPAFVLEQRGNSIGQDLEQPLGAQTQVVHHAVTAAIAVRTDMHQSNASCAFDLADPLRTITTGGGHAVAAAALAPAIMANNQNNVGVPVDDPLPTLTTGNRNFVTGAVLAPAFAGCGGRAAQVPPSRPVEPIGTLTTKADRIVCAATLVQTGYGERRGQAPRALDLEEPLGTQVAGGAKHAVVGAWMAQHNLDAVGHAAVEPLSTLTTRGTQQQVAAASLVKLRGTSTAQAVEEPVPTLSAGGNHIGCVAAFLTKYYGQGGVAQAADDPLHALSTRPRFGVITTTIAGEPYVVTDIMMRMLEPHEAAAAHELRLPREITLNGVRRPLTKTDAMRLVGNSVPKRMAMLIARANRVHALDVAPAVAAE